MKTTLPVLILLLAGSAVLSEELAERYSFTNVNVQEAVAWKADTAPDARVVYGKNSAPQHADLRIPSTRVPRSGYPVIVFIHGGAWRSEWSRNYSEAFVEALAEQGFATWDLEFRRMGHHGGGYPGTFEDIADGADLSATGRRILSTEPGQGHCRRPFIGRSSCFVAGRSISAARIQRYFTSGQSYWSYEASFPSPA